MNSTHDQRRDAGLTLVEVTVAMALLTTIVAGVAATLSSAQLASSSTRERQAVSAAAFRHLDLVVATDPEQIVAVWDGTAFDVPAGVGGAFLAPATAPVNSGPDAGRPGRIAVVADPEGDGSGDLLEVRVTVAWRSLLGGDRTLAFASRVTR